MRQGARLSDSTSGLAVTAAMRSVLFLALAISVTSCADSTTDPRPEPFLLGNPSFEKDGEPTLAGWESLHPSLSHLVDTRSGGSPDGGSWCLRLKGGWTPSVGTVVTPVFGLRQGDVVEISAWVRRLPYQFDCGDGGARVAIATGESRTDFARYKSVTSLDTTWTEVTVVDTVTTVRDSVWVVLSGLHDPICAPVGLVDDVSLRLIQR
jgi:hypothetical protein